MGIIKEVKAITVSVPLDNPTSFSNRQVLKRDYALVEITSDSGHKGIGFCYGGSNAGGLVTQAVRELLRPVLVGQETYQVEGLWQKMYQEALLHGRAGSVMRAISIIDTALWDHNARAAGLPLYKLLGAHQLKSVAAYASGGYYLDGKRPEDLANEMRGYVSQGFKAVKLKVGRESLAQEEARLAAVREAVGPEVLVMMDANNAWRDLPSALAFMRMAEPYDPYWIEEPFSPDDIENHRRLAERTPVPVATGEIEAGRWRFKELLDQQAAMILQTDAAVCGGITEFRRITATAASYGIDVCPHWFHDLHVHLVAASPNTPFVEYFADDQVLNFRRLIDTQLVAEDGRLLLPKSPGLGFDFDAESVARYAIGEWQ